MGAFFVDASIKTRFIKVAKVEQSMINEITAKITNIADKEVWHINFKSSQKRASDGKEAWVSIAIADINDFSKALKQAQTTIQLQVEGKI
jgi:hypothetical protein